MRVGEVRREEGASACPPRDSMVLGENMGSWVRTWDPWEDLGLGPSSVTYQMSGVDSVTLP